MKAPGDWRAVFVCSTFPTRQHPNLGLVNAIQLQALARQGDFQVLYPQPYFPLLRPWVTGQRDYAGIPVTDVPVPYLPSSRGPFNSALYAWGIQNRLTKLCAAYRPRFLLTSFAFPDNVGVARLAPKLGLPLVSIIRGTDIHTYCQMPARWRAIVAGLRSAAVVIARSRSLAAKVTDAGVPQKNVHVVYNGVDHETFHPRDRHEVSRELGLPPERRRILFVGSLNPVKSIPVLLEAFTRLDEQTDLYLIGDGPERDTLPRPARVHFLGEQPHHEIARWMAACDLVCLPSLNEGVPNVVLESFACGRPVVASRVGGIPEIHPGPSHGALTEAGNAADLAEKLAWALDQKWDAQAIAASARQFSWRSNAETIWQLIRERC